MGKMTGKIIVLGITGSIAAYKSLHILRDLKALGAEVRIVLTRSAEHFVPPLTLKVFSGHPVYTSLFEPEREMAHLQLAEEADLVLIAPATAHFIAKMALGLADDLLSTLLLATRAPLFIAPAMDLGMWDHPTVKKHVAQLRKRGAAFIEPECGPLASGKEGQGRLAEEKKIVARLADFFSMAHPDYSDEVVLITAGPTQEPIDPVRFISNRSSGKMGYALAKTAAQWGGRVILISGPTHLDVPVGVERISVRTAEEMRAAFMHALPESSLVIMAAAVSDFRAAHSCDQKLKKTGKATSILLEETEDIIAGRGEGSQFVVGFAAETENLLENAKAKRRGKNLDLIVANDVTEAGAGFDVETNIAHLIDSADQVLSLPKMSKVDLAQKILIEIAKMKSAPARGIS